MSDEPDLCPECGSELADDLGWICGSQDCTGTFVQSGACCRIVDLQQTLAEQNKQVGQIIKVARIATGAGMREFAESIGMLPSRICDIEQGAATTAQELTAIAAKVESNRQEGYRWRDKTVAALLAAEEQVKQLEEKLREKASPATGAEIKVAVVCEDGKVVDVYSQHEIDYEVFDYAELEGQGKTREEATAIVMKLLERYDPAPHH